MKNSENQKCNDNKSPKTNSSLCEQLQTVWSTIKQEYKNDTIEMDYNYVIKYLDNFSSKISEEGKIGLNKIIKTIETYNKNDSERNNNNNRLSGWDKYATKIIQSQLIQIIFVFNACINDSLYRKIMSLK